jgi:NAD(P)-dependent dehydrogenase (short-subunit alcohol dehydrogenase family)
VAETSDQLEDLRFCHLGLQFAPQDYERALKNVPLQRIGDPRRDVGALVAFLLSDDACYITAQTIHVDGGTGSFR